MQYIESPNKYEGRIKKLRFVVWHDMEMPEASDTAERVARYFAKPSSKASAHICADPDSVVECVKPGDTAWHAKGGNAEGYGVELAGYARQDPAQWADAGSKSTIRNAARAVAPVVKANAIPSRWLTDAQVADGVSKGHTTHAQITRVTGKGSHTDPGPSFPSAFVMECVREATGGAVRPAPAPARPVVAQSQSGPTAVKPAPASTLKEDGVLGEATIKRWQQVMRTTVDGVISKPKSSLVMAVQKRLNEYGNSVKVDGDLGPATIRALQRYLGVPQDGVLNSPDQAVQALQHRLNAGRF